ncbi:DUF4302 domain-containing protein [Sphingobacterium sp. ML3W]|uniref:DUF4302 domain-containing protein n=1 Tax=Sphingobacterium sp. ML3W TaxID=1538644 RepID=UPI00249BF705|nr:DUF4302 domain-containing protein [Sphingobacterium sp. ML3W]WFA78843.1 DUF4302 domain-containing protein [Sphingobacterium sp. ML3W]
MKLKYLFFLLLLPAFWISSCKRDDDRIFETNATVRMTEAVQQAYTVLQANKAGWMMKFYPSSNQEFGGYTIFTKFISKEEVSVASDPFSGFKTSTYSVNPESGPVLSFDGYNKNIHWFSEPGKDNGGIGADDSGMRGDFEFIVLKATADSVVLKGKKSGSHLVMLPLKGTEFESMSKAYQEAASKFKEFEIYQLETAGNKIVELGYDPTMRVFSNPSDPSAKDMSFRVVPGGLEFYEPYTIAGKAVDRVDFVAPTSTYPYGYYTDKDKTLKIIPVPTPLNRWFRNNLWSASYKNMGALGQLYWNAGRPMLKERGIVVNNFYIGKNGPDGGIIWVLQGGSVVGGLTHVIQPIADTEDQVYIELEGYGVGNFVLAHWQGGLNYLSAPFDGNTFKITADNALKPSVITLSDMADSRNVIKLTLDDIDDPLNN